MAHALGDTRDRQRACHDDLGWRWRIRWRRCRRAPAIECTVNGIGERAGMRAGRDRDGLARRAATACRMRRKNRDRASLRGQPVLTSQHHVRAAPEQGDCGRERVRARSGHSSGWVLERADDLRDPRSDVCGRAGKASWCWANTAAGTLLQKRGEDLGFPLEQRPVRSCCIIASRRSRIARRACPTTRSRARTGSGQTRRPSRRTINPIAHAHGSVTSATVKANSQQRMNLKILILPGDGMAPR